MTEGGGRAMGRIAEATLTDGRKIQYVITDNPPGAA